MDDKDQDQSDTGTGTAGSTLGGAAAGAVAGTALGLPVIGTVIGALSHSGRLRTQQLPARYLKRFGCSRARRANSIERPGTDPSRT